MARARAKCTREVGGRRESAMLCHVGDLHAGVFQQPFRLEVPPVGQNIQRRTARDLAAHARQMCGRDAEKRGIVLDPVGAAEITFDKRGISLGQTMRR